MKIDLHNHTKHSDGTLTPFELVERAKMNDVDILAITDHDSVFGIEEALKAGIELQVGVIPGIELSTEHKGESVHIIGLFINGAISPFFEHFSNDLVDKRIDRAKKMMHNIQVIYGLKVDFEYLFSNGQVITRGNMLRCLMYSNPNMTMDEARKFIDKDSLAYIPSTKLSIKEGIKMLHENNAIAILAHPTLLKSIDVSEILDFGFDGIEAIYPANKALEEEKFRNLAKKFNLLVSAGSDCHGDMSHSDIGTATITEDDFSLIAKKINYEIQVKK